MASWKTHIKITHELINALPELDTIDFIVGNIAPDCNLENEDFTSFVPPRRETHYMLGDSKLTVDAKGFIKKYLHSELVSNRDFYLGYLAHLITDMEFQKYIREPKRVANIYKRLHKEGLSEQFANLPEDFDTLKAIYSKQTIFENLEVFENNDVTYRPTWNRLLEVNHYVIPIAGFKEDAVNRKIPVMTCEEKVSGSNGLFFDQTRYLEFISHVVTILIEQINDLT